MSDVQRWDMFAEVGINEPVKYGMWEAVEGGYVTYADHVAAIAGALNEYRQQHDGISERYFRQIQIDAMGKARDAVAAECHHDDPNEWCVFTAAIDALRASNE